jgi:CHAT domain-containing protein
MLYRILVQPAEKLIPRGSTVVIIADGSLVRLNFETLVMPGATPHYWIEGAELESASSMTLLAGAKRQRPRNAKDLLLMGDTVQANPDFGALKYAGDEVRQVAAHFTQPKIVTGKDATPSAYAASGPGDFRYIHLVAHGTASQLSPLESAVILSPEGENSYKLYAREIVKTPLHAELVTISACRGAGTREYSGEGLVGLGWAFLRAGAHQVVAGLWEVNDLSTPQLMDRFYSELQKGRSAPAALRTAKLAMLRSDSVYRHPFFWGSMQLYVGP